MFYVSRNMANSALIQTPVAIIVGASSGIGEALARKYAKEGYQVALLARRAERIEKLAAELGADRARAYPHDVTQTAEAAPLFQRILADFGRVDVLIYNSGLLVPVGLNEFNFEKDRQMVEVNVLGALAWLNPAAQLFEAQQSGCLIGISSVAGDRGRVGAPAYNTTKAALSTYLEALRNRLTRKGVHVLTVKPGFVATEMLKNSPRTFWVISPEQAAKDVYDAMRAHKQEIYTPARWGLLMFIIRNLPSFIFRRLKF